MKNIAEELSNLVDTTAQKLRTLDVERVRIRPAPNKWSVQEIIGHLLDSAVNNHHRFIRAQEDGSLVFPKYEQDYWVEVQRYRETSWPELVELWRLYNRHLAHVIERVPEEKLNVECRIGPSEPVTLGFLIEDYVVHMRHHLRQIEAQL
jgi:hypothetical protein